VSKFPDDYPIETLQGARRPGHHARMRVLAGRVAWLITKIMTFPERARDPAAGYLARELATIAIVVEMIEGRFPMGAPQRFTRHELEILRTLVGARAALQHDPDYQTLLTKITGIQANIANQAEQEQE
jgi:hypothetical protein